MLSHVVLMTPRADASREDREALVSAFERAVREIPTVRGVRVGRRIRHGAGYEAAAPEHLILIDFDDIDGLHAYLEHPAHQALAASFGALVETASIFDCEIVPLRTLTQFV